jgi:hypothetical protein
VIIGTVLPFLIIFISNIIIILTLKQAASDRNKLDKHGQKEADLQHLTRMLIFVSFAYVITTLPYRLHHFAMKIPAVAAAYDLRVLFWRKKYVVTTWSLSVVWMFNYSINFYLYCLGGGRRYRNDARRVVSTLCRYRQ